MNGTRLVRNKTGAKFAIVLKETFVDFSFKSVAEFAIVKKETSVGFYGRSFFISIVNTL